MQKSQLGRFLLIAMITFFIIFILSVVLLPQTNFRRYDYSAFFEISLTWILRFTGLSLIIFSVISLIIDGSALTEVTNLAKWITLIMLGILIIEATWSLAFGITIILVALIVLSYLKDGVKAAGVKESDLV